MNKSHIRTVQSRTGAKNLGSLLEANISDIDIVIDDNIDKNLGIEEDYLSDFDSLDSDFNSSIQKSAVYDEFFAKLNFSEDDLNVPEVPFLHWSIYKQSIHNIIGKQKNKLARNQKQLNKLIS